MLRNTGQLLIVLLPLLLLQALILTPGSDAQQSRNPGVAKIYANSCRSCHLVPDKRFATDRAWVGQIIRTA